MTEAVRAIIDRIPALRELRGAARIEAEEVLQDALDDWVEAWAADAELTPDSEASNG